MRKVSTQVPVFDLKDYKPTPHPMQHRIDEFRSIPSLVTGGRVYESRERI